MKKITKRNYFSPNNRGLSNSKTGDWLKDKRYFLERHILGLHVRKVTDPMIMGSAVDCWLTEGEKTFREKYYVVSRRDTKAKDYEFQLNKTMWDKVEKMCRLVETQDAYKALRGYKKQQIIQCEMDLGEHFDCLIGKPDWYKVDGDKLTIVDLKTAESANPHKYHFKCLDYGYYRQMAMYGYILHCLYPEISKYEFKHLVVEKDKDDVYRIHTFELSKKDVLIQTENLLDIFGDIKAEKKFMPHNAKWEDLIVIGSQEYEFI